MNMDEQPKITLLEEKEYKIKPFAQLIVGDPIYKGTPDDNRLTLYKKLFKSDRDAGLIVQKKHFDFSELSYDSYTVIAYSAKRNPIAKQIIEAHREGMYFPNQVKSNMDLGCDTAQYDITVDGRTENIQTGADGSFGQFFCYKDNDAYVLELDLPDNYCPIEKYLSSLAYVFDCKELKKELGVETKNCELSKE